MSSAAQFQDERARALLHTGDLVLLKTQLKAEELYAECGEVPGDTGYINTDGLRGDLRIFPVDTLHSSGLDVREFLFVVVDQLNYIAAKDLSRFRKHLRLQGGDGGPLSSAAAAKMKTFEDRARLEEEQNSEKMTSHPRPVLYGDIIQLRHLRTKRFLRIRVKSQAALQHTSRRVDLHTGSVSSWIRVNPFFEHKSQGVPVMLNEQVLLESVKLGNHWGLHWAKCQNMAREMVYEINCARNGRGFYIELYSRSMAQQSKVLSCPSPLRLVNLKHSGFVSASPSKAKPLAYLRRGPLGDKNKSSKDIWVIEPGLPNHGDRGLEWHTTPVLLRHFASGRYLAISATDLEQALSGDLGDIPIPGKSPKAPSPTARNRRRQVALVDAPTLIQTELVEDPGPATWFRLEPADLQAVTPGMTSIPCGGYMLVRWDSPSGGKSFWLSCQGKQKGERRSLQLHWSSVMYSLDTIRVEVLDDPTCIMDDSDWLYECDVVAEHKKFLRKSITPRCADFADADVAAMVCSHCQDALSDMILFLSGSPSWRSNEVQYQEVDALLEPWTAKPERQRLALELKYIDATFDLFHEFVQCTQSLVDGDVQWGRRAVVLNLSLQVRPGETGNPEGDMDKWRQLMRNTVESMKTRCLKLLVRLWLATFLNSRKVELYFLKNGWVETINTLNGHGLGASDVFVALLGNNAALVRQVDRSTVLKFIDFIRVLGPLDTWLSFLVALCAPAESAVGGMQQLVLESLFYAGDRASPERQEATEKNKRELLVALRLVSGRSLGIALSQPLGGRSPPLEKCLGRSLLSEGLMDIAVSWAHPPNWVVGRDVLYHGPQSLGLTPIEKTDMDDDRTWVSLADVVWVLQPERCCEPVTGMTWDDVQANDTGGDIGFGDVFTTEDAARMKSMDVEARSAIITSRLHRLKTLAKYFLAQLQVISDLVKERQMNCILSLQEEYSFELCICGSSDPRLPTSIRAAFFDILTDLWLDRHPHMQVVVPQLMRFIGKEDEAVDRLPVFSLTNPELPDAWSQEHVDRMAPEVHSFYRLGTPHKMEAVLRVVRRFLGAGPRVEQQVHSDTDYNVLLLALLRILQALLRYGFIHSVELLRDIVGPLMRCLDGRTDLLRPLEVEDAGNGNSDGEHLQIDEPFTPLLQGLSGGGSPIAAAGRLKACRFPPLDDGRDRWEASYENTPVMECKVVMLNMALHTVQLAHHTKMSRVFSIFRQNVLETEAAQSAAAVGTALVLPSAVIDEFLVIIDDPAVTLSWPGIRNPAAMCVDLMMYEHTQMFALGLQLLFAECCQTTVLFEHLHKMEILTSAQQETFQSIKNDVAALGKLLYSFESWGVDDSFSVDDPSKMMQLQKICLKLRSLAAVGDSHATPMEVQKMMHETEFFSHFVYAVKIDQTDYPPSSHPILAKVTGLVCSCASRFVAANKKNQALMFSVLENALWVLDDQPDMALLFVSIFEQNTELCEQITPELVDRFGGLIERERQAGRFSPWFLQFYIAITVAEGKGIVRNQVMVVDMIKQRTSEVTLHLLQGDAGLDRVIHLATHFKSMGQLRDIEPSRWVGGVDAELIYYIRSVELLINLSTGKGIHNLVNKPWVASLFPVPSLLKLLMRSGFDIPVPEREETTVSIHTRLKTLWLKLLVFMLYDVDKRLVDMEMLSGPLHVSFFGTMLEWIKQSLEVINQGQSKDEVSFLTEEDEGFVVVMLRCVDCFFKHIYHQVKGFDVCADLCKVAERYSKPFAAIVESASDASGFACGLREVEFLQVVAVRVVSAINPSAASAYDRIAKKPTRRTGKSLQGNSVVSSEAEGQWRIMVEALEADPDIHRRVLAEEARVGQIITTIGELTDPGRAEYVKKLPSGSEDCLPDGVDFRRAHITTEAVLARCVRHGSESLGSDLGSVRLIQRMLLSVLVTARNSGDMQQLLRLQDCCVRSGVAGLLIQILDSHVAEDVTKNAWTLLAEVLCTGRRVGDIFVAPEDDNVPLVNKTVQQGILDVCIHGDDSGMWESLWQVMHLVGQTARVAHALSHLSSLTEVEARQVADHKEYLSYAVRIMEAIRLMVDGHYEAMQEYLFAQVGNGRSFNVLEIVLDLLARLCKDPLAANISELCEVECLNQCLRLLMELSQGPNLRNQDFLVAMGFVDNALMLLGANFDRIQKQANDLYPSPIRYLKTNLLETVLSLVEGRLDTKLHQRILQSLEVETLSERIQFVYIYIVFGMVEVSRGKLRTNASCALPLSSNACLHFSRMADPAEVNAKLLPAQDIAEELLEDLLDEELDELFSEALNVLEVIYNLSPVSKEFQKQVLPVKEEEFIDDLTRFEGSQREFLVARAGYYKRENYRLAFQFMERFVKTIEVMLEGNLQQLHFQTPLTAMWYVQETAKQHILDTIPFAVPDLKAKAFIQMCVEAHGEAKHIRKLSRFSIVPAGCLKLARRHLPDSAHRPFQIFLANDARLMQRLVQAALLLGLAIALHVSIFLVPKDTLEGLDGSSGSHESTTWTSPLTERVAFSMGGVYFACTGLWVALTVCIQVPLNMQSQHDPGRRSLTKAATAVLMLLKDAYTSWRIALLCFCGGALFASHFWLFSFLLLDFFCQNTLLATVLKAVSAPFRSLMMTFIGAVIVTFVYAAIGFHWFRFEFGDYCNENVLTCTQNILYQGTRNGIIGLSSMMKPVMPGSEDWTGRMLFDISYFIVYGIMILNTIVGLIVDSFSAIRHEQERRQLSLDTQSFISCIDRKNIDVVAQAQGISDGFSYHETHKQNKWDYMAFIFYLCETRLLDCTGPERVIRIQLEEGDYKWLPLGHSMMLERATEETVGHEDAIPRIERQLDRMDREVGAAEDWAALTRTLADVTTFVRTRLDRMQDQVEKAWLALRDPANQQVPSPLASPIAARPPARQGSMAAGRTMTRAL